MADTAAHLVDRVLPEVSIRQWVLTLPYPLRYREPACEITDPVGHPVMMMAEDDRGDLDDRSSTRNQA